MFFTYWTHDSGSADLNATTALPMKSEWLREFEDFTVYDDSAVLPLLSRFGNDIPGLFRRIRIPSCKSDIARLVLLSEFGGLYIDAHTGIGNKTVLSRLVSTLPQCEVLLFDLVQKHKREGDISIPNGAIYSRPRSPIIEMFISSAIENIRNQFDKETSSGGYVPYNLAVLTGAWIIASTLFSLKERPFTLKGEFSNRVKIWPLTDGGDDPIRFYQYYSYRAPLMHWSERQNREPLFAQGVLSPLYPAEPEGVRLRNMDEHSRPATPQTVTGIGVRRSDPATLNRKPATMPSSATFGKPFTYFLVKELARRASPLPLRMLDVGAGLATYPKMLKGVLPGCKFTGIEVWSPYIENFDLNYWYDQLIIADVRYLDWSKVPRFDVAFFGDILEHMTRYEAAAAVMAAANVGGCVVTSIPLGHHPQHAEHGNPWERHISENWDVDELPKVFADVLGTHVHSFIGVSVICSNPALRKSVMDAYSAASNVMKANVEKIEKLDQHDYTSLRSVLDKIENG